MGIKDMADKAKDALKGHEDKADDAVEKVGDKADDMTGGKFESQVDTGQEQAKDYLEDDEV
jgi:hypothetical protein